MRCRPLGLTIEKSRIRETSNLLTDADSSTNVFVSAGVKKGADSTCRALGPARSFHQIGPLGRYSLVVAMSVCCGLCVVCCLLSPSHAILPGEQRRSQGSKAVSHCGLSTLKNAHQEMYIITTGNLPPPSKLYKKSCIRETKNFLTDANSRTDTIFKRLFDLSKSFFFLF